MPPVDGATVVIQVSATAVGTKTPVNGLTRFSRRRTKGFNRTTVFMRSTPWLSRQQRTHSFTVTGKRITADAGQQMIRDAEISGATVFLTVMWDGTNGFMQEVYPTELSDDASPTDFVDHGFSFEAADEPALVGTGPLN